MPNRVATIGRASTTAANARRIPSAQWTNCAATGLSIARAPEIPHFDQQRKRRVVAVRLVVQRVFGQKSLGQIEMVAECVAGRGRGQRPNERAQACDDGKQQHPAEQPPSRRSPTWREFAFEHRGGGLFRRIVASSAPFDPSTETLRPIPRTPRPDSSRRSADDTKRRPVPRPPARAPQRSSRSPDSTPRWSIHPPPSTPNPRTNGRPSPWAARRIVPIVSKEMSGSSMSVVSCQWAVGSGQWAVGSRQSAVGSRQWAVGSGPLANPFVSFVFFVVPFRFPLSLEHRQTEYGRDHHEPCDERPGLPGGDGTALVRRRGL